MKIPFPLFFLIFVASPSLSLRIIDDKMLIFNVINYGAKGDGQTDDSQAFLKAWNDVCATAGTPTLFVPKGKTFMLQPLLFQGPCKSTSITVNLQGNIIAPRTTNAWKWTNNNKDVWIDFSSINNLVINGGGQIDGQGASWWKSNPADNQRPTALHFHNCNNLQLSHLTHVNSPRNHLGVNSCNGARISDVHILAPEDSPNTDGIDISGSTNIVISHSEMETGDDCIAINGGSSFINIMDIKCGPGHGISIGSLGANGAHDIVEEVYVRNCTFTQTSNGARIKTWEGGFGYAKNITFEDIILNAVQNPLIIDQRYNGFNPNALDASKAVGVSDVTFRNIQGTSTSEIAIKFNCDNVVSCTDIVLDQINITSIDPEKIERASCNNVKGKMISSTIPNVPCLEKMSYF